MNIKVRLVRCPRCRKLLPEFPNVPVYECAGCGTVLQAKIRKADINGTEPRSQEIDLPQENGLEHASDDRETSSLNQQTVPFSDKSAAEKITKRGQDEFEDCNRDPIGGAKRSDDLPSSNERICHENIVSSREITSHTEADEVKCQFEQSDIREKNGSGDIKFSDQASSSTESNSDQNELSSQEARAHIELEQNDERGHCESGDSSRDWKGNLKISEENFSSGELLYNDIEKPSEVAGTDTEVDENVNGRFIYRNSSAEDLSRRDSFVTAQVSFGESILSENPMSPSKEQMQQGQNGLFQSLERISSVDTLENIPLVNPSSDLGVKLREMFKSPIANSYYAYDGSESSCNENDYEVPVRNFHVPKRNLKDADFVSTKGLPKNDFRAMGTPPKHHATKGSKWGRDEFSVRSKMRVERDESPSRVPFYSRDTQVGPSNYGHNEFQSNSIGLPPKKPEYNEANKVELLRMVYELQHQLDRKYIQKENSSIRSSPIIAPERGIYCPKYPGRYNQGKCGSHQCKTSRMAFSGEVPQLRHQADCACLNCCPQERHFSAQLPPHFGCCNKGHNYYSPHNSGPTSPLLYTGSEFSSWARDTSSDDQRHIENGIKRLNLREKNHAVKRHSRPIAGGSPIITCYKCFSLLQMPTDFLLFKRKCHRLRCSACSEILKFSVQNKVHIVRYTAEAIAPPPPSEVDDYNTNAIENTNLASSSHAERISCSDDYGPSFSKSYSTEADIMSFIIPTFHTLQRKANDRKMSSSSSFEPEEEREIPLVRKSKKKNPGETFNSVGTSSDMSKRENLSSEIEEIPRTTASPLHRLMGYSSLSKVISR